MKILALADQESKSLWDYYDPERVKGVELIISCGDLDAAYLEFLVTMTNCPVLYVMGNHDTEYLRNPPGGCTDIDGNIVRAGGLRIAGLGGCMKYHESPLQFTEKEMEKRVRSLHRKAVMAGGIDVLVTHAPVQGTGDMEDLPHRGFACFHDLLNRWKPAYMLHGHVHQTYGSGFRRTFRHESGTMIVNACERCLIDVTPASSGCGLYERLRPLKLSGAGRQTAER